MTKNEYMKVLSHKLRRLPKEDYSRAIEYFEEYFTEAGPGHEEQAIKDLGDPEEAANALIVDFAARNAEEPPKTVRKGLSAVWIAILAVFAAPVALPVAVVLILAVGMVLVCVGIALFCVAVSSVSVCAGGILGIFGGILLLFQSPGDGLCNLGAGLFCTWAGLMLIYGSVLLFKWIIKKAASSLGKLTKRRARK